MASQKANKASLAISCGNCSICCHNRFSSSANRAYLCSATVEKAGPFNSNVLSSLLSILAGHDEASDKPSWAQREHVRSPTRSPPPESNGCFQAYCHDELVKAGGRPVMSFELLPQISKDAKANWERLELWLDDTDLGS